MVPIEFACIQRKKEGGRDERRREEGEKEGGRREGGREREEERQGIIQSLVNKGAPTVALTEPSESQDD